MAFVSFVVALFYWIKFFLPLILMYSIGLGILLGIVAIFLYFLLKPLEKVVAFFHKLKKML